jgi:hypothetical protein
MGKTNHHNFPGVNHLGKHIYIRKIANSIARILLIFNIPFNELFEAIRIELVKEAIKAEPKITNVQLSVKTGLDRRDVAKYKRSTEVITKPSNLTLIMEKVSHYCERKEGNRIPIKGHIESFYGYAEKICNGAQTPNSLAQELISHGCIKEDGENFILLSKEIIYKKDRKNFLNILANTFNYFISTLTDNYTALDKGLRKKQFTMVSTQIHPKYFLQLKQMSDKKIDQFKKEYDKEILLPFEEQTQPGVYVKPGTYPAFGFSSFAVMPENCCPLDRSIE